MNVETSIKMSKIKNDRFKREILNEVKHTSRSGNKEGYCKFYKNNTKEHEDAKWDIFCRLKKLGFEVWTEVTFTNGFRADILAIDNSTALCFEILGSETEEMCKLKEDKYPCKIIMIKASEAKDFPL